MEWQFDQISYWSEVKLDIISEYAKAYTKSGMAITTAATIRIFRHGLRRCVIGCA